MGINILFKNKIEFSIVGLLKWCSQSFLLKNLTIAWFPFLLRSWHDSVPSPIIWTLMCCRTLHTVCSNWLWSINGGTTIVSTHSLQLCWAFVQNCLSREATCFTNPSSIFWIQQRLTEVSKPQRLKPQPQLNVWLLKVGFSSLISSANDVTIFALNSCIFKNKSIICDLLKELRVFSVHTSARMLVSSNATAVIKIYK